jgi:hypothetical protein
MPTSLHLQAARRCRAERACCKPIFQLFQMFHSYIASVSYGCCKSRLRCCIYCNGCTRMLQASVSNVSSGFSDIYCKCVYLQVAYVSHICCKCFIWILCMFYNGF